MTNSVETETVKRYTVGMDSNELLTTFENTLPNRGKWHWSGDDGARPRTLTVVQKLLKAGVKEQQIKELVTDLFFTAFVEYERAVFDRTGVRVKDIPTKPEQPLQIGNGSSVAENAAVGGS